MAAARKLLFLHRRSPWAGGRARELLEVGLIASAFEQEIHVMFLDDGVFQLVSGAEPLAALLREIAELDADHVWVEAESLAERGLSAADLLIPAHPAARADLAGLIAGMDAVFTA